MVSHDYLDKVSVFAWLTVQIQSRTFWCPRDYDDAYWTNGKMIVHRNCPRPPTKKQLYDLIIAEQMDRGLNTGINYKHLPDKRWMLMCLATMNP